MIYASSIKSEKHEKNSIFSSKPILININGVLVVLYKNISAMIIYYESSIIEVTLSLVTLLNILAKRSLSCKILYIFYVIVNQDLAKT